MKNLVLIFVSLLLLLSTLIGSCKKKNSDPGDDKVKKFRLVSEKFFAANGSRTVSSFSFAEDKLTHREFHDGSNSYIFDYVYDNDKVLAEVLSYADSALVKIDKTEYLFDGGLLAEIISRKNEAGNWVKTSTIDFDYNGIKPVQYIETHLSEPYAKGVYGYENNQLTSFEVYHYNEGWVKWLTDEMSYSGDTLREFYSTITTFGVLKIKMVYQYQDGLLGTIKSFAYLNGDWELTYLTDYTYDENGNAVLEKVWFAADSTVFYYTEYKYEEGGSNLGSIIYSGIPDDPDLIYPKPLNTLPNRQLLKTLYEGGLIK